MTDIVERLREYNEPPFDYIAHEAAAKIEHLRFAWDTTSAECNKLIIEIEQLREALFDMSGYISRADMHYLKPETLIALKEKE